MKNALIDKGNSVPGLTVCRVNKERNIKGIVSMDLQDIVAKLCCDYQDHNIDFGMAIKKYFILNLI